MMFFVVLVRSMCRISKVHHLLLWLLLLAPGNTSMSDVGGNYCTDE